MLKGECVSSHLVGQPQMRWIDSVNYCLKKRGLNVGQARRMVRVCTWKCLRHSRGYELLTSTRCYSCGLSQIYETLRDGGLSVAKPVT